ncbi:MAG: hypothetical protein AVDCRST_MAG09-1916, partial [uncultured Sphingomonas sp.]
VDPDVLHRTRCRVPPRRGRGDPDQRPRSVPQCRGGLGKHGRSCSAHAILSRRPCGRKGPAWRV